MTEERKKLSWKKPTENKYGKRELSRNIEIYIYIYIYEFQKVDRLRRLGLLQNNRGADYIFALRERIRDMRKTVDYEIKSIA